MKRNENKLITLVIDQSKMTKEQDKKAWWDLIQQGWADGTVLYIGRGNCTIDDESEVQDD